VSVCVGGKQQEKQASRERRAQIQDYKRVTGAIDRCQLCFASASRGRHLTVAIGQTAYLSVPAR
jgi:Protein similar to CwfJ C-terminus 1